MMNNLIINLSDLNFKKTIDSDNKFVLIDFWAEWCGPCRTLSHVLEEIINDYTNNLIIGKLNIDKYANIANDYEIRSIPSLILFKKSKIIDKQIGLMSTMQLKNFLDKHL